MKPPLNIFDSNVLLGVLFLTGTLGIILLLTVKIGKPSQKPVYYHSQPYDTGSFRDVVATIVILIIAFIYLVWSS